MTTAGVIRAAVDRKRALDEAVTSLVAERHGRVAFQSDDRAVIFTGRPVNHLLHLVVTVLTAGAWVLPWLIITLSNHEDAHTLTVDSAGVVSETVSGRTRVVGRLRRVRVVAALVIVGSLGALLAVRAPALRVTLLGLVVVGVAVIAVDVARRGIASVVPKVRVLPPR